MPTNVTPRSDDPVYWASIYRLTATNFRLSAEKLALSLELREDGTPAKLAAIPFYYMVSHSIELFLKSALLERGHALSDLRRVENRHNLDGLLDLLVDNGLPISPELRALIHGLSEQHGDHLLRYHLLTNPFIPAPSAIWPLLDELLLLTRISTQGR